MVVSPVIPRKGVDMGMWKVKSCPRCGGDLFIDRDLDSWYAQCLMCAYRNELREISGLKKSHAKTDSKPALDPSAPI